MSESRNTFIVTCEHGGNNVPARYRPLFRGMESLLDSHRGYDPGALVMARQLAGAFDAPLINSTVSRLLVELNRSPWHRQLFSDATRDLPADIRAAIIERYYRPYRARVEESVRDALSSGNGVIHISSHSFTPVLYGEVRNADVGLLYDPRRPGEAGLCVRWQAALAAIAPDLKVRRNYPYAGKGDGLTTHLRRRYPAAAYVGVELEVNQAIVAAGGRRWAAVRQVLVESLRTASGWR